MLISGVRIAAETSSPARKTPGRPAASRKDSAIPRASSPSRAASLQGIPARRAARAHARYIAPVSRRTNPALSASRFETVLFPAPEGPSIVTTGRVLIRTTLRASS